MEKQTFNYDFSAFQPSIFSIDFTKERDTLFDEMFTDKSYGDYLDIFMVNGTNQQQTAQNESKHEVKPYSCCAPEMSKGIIISIWKHNDSKKKLRYCTNSRMYFVYSMVLAQCFTCGFN